jgi:hypothetical protein
MYSLLFLLFLLFLLYNTKTKILRVYPRTAPCFIQPRPPTHSPK